MATLLPAIGACVSRMTPGERRLAERLEHKLDDCTTRDLCAQVLHQRQLPVEMRRGLGDFDPTNNTLKVMTMLVSKGLEFPVVALPRVGHMPAKREGGQEAARVFDVAATGATQRLVITVSGEAKFASQLTATNT